MFKGVNIYYVISINSLPDYVYNRYRPRPTLENRRLGLPCGSRFGYSDCPPTQTCTRSGFCGVVVDDYEYGKF
jgi:hypothetical protein